MRPDHGTLSGRHLMPETRDPRAEILVCVGDALVDLIVRVESLPRRGRTTWGKPPTRVAGGTAANVAAGAAHLGQRASFVGRVGDDDHGRFLTEDLRGRGVAVGGVACDAEAGTGVAISLVEPDGERTFLACGLGAAQTRLMDEDLVTVRASPPAAVFLTGLLLMEEPARGTTVRLARWLHDIGVTTFFDPNLRQPSAAMPVALRDAMLEVSALASVVLAGEEEASDLGLAARASQVLAVKRGANGACLRVGDMTVHDVPGLAVSAVDATGAGDAFDAAFIVAWMEGRSNHEALAFANVAAALSVERLGARAMPDRDAVDRRLGVEAG